MSKDPTKPTAWRYENKNVKGNWYITWTEPPDGFNKRPLYDDSALQAAIAEYRNKVIEECAAVLNVAITRLSSCGASIKNDVAISTLKEQSCRLRAMKEQP